MRGELLYLSKDPPISFSEQLHEPKEYGPPLCEGGNQGSLGSRSSDQKQNLRGDLLLS